MDYIMGHGRVQVFYCAGLLDKERESYHNKESNGKWAAEGILMIELRNRKGETLKANIRRARPGEADRLVELVSKQYGALNPEAVFYDAARLARLMREEEMVFGVAESEKGLFLGMICADLRGGDGVFFRLLTVRPAYRGFGLGERIQDFLDTNPDLETLSHGYVHCLTVDIVSQMIKWRRGYRPTGLLLNRYFFDKDAENLSGLSLPQRRSHLVMCKPFAGGGRAGLLYVPEEHAAFVGGVCDSLAQEYAPAAGRRAPESAGAVLEHVWNAEHRYCELVIRGADAGFERKLEKTLNRYAAANGLSCNALVDASRESAPLACAILEKFGFFFAGLTPICGKEKFLILHRSDDAASVLDKAKVLPGFEDQFAYIKACLRKDAAV
jgi:GNAT superfamily N-acetyltransferase